MLHPGGKGPIDGPLPVLADCASAQILLLRHIEEFVVGLLGLVIPPPVDAILQQRQLIVPPPGAGVRDLEAQIGSERCWDSPTLGRSVIGVRVLYARLADTDKMQVHRMHLREGGRRVGEGRGIELPVVLIPIVVVDESIDRYLAIPKLLPFVLHVGDILVSPPAEQEAKGPSRRNRSIT